MLEEVHRLCQCFRLEPTLLRLLEEEEYLADEKCK